MIMNRLCYAAKLKHLIEIIKRLTPYAVFLSRNRHSSHIIQAILARLCYLLKNEGIGNLDEEYLRTTTLGFLSLILKEISWLAKELSASHVVRSALCALAGMCQSKRQSNHHTPVKFPVKFPLKFSLNDLCALTGIPIVSERKGKGSKHQHSVSLSEPLESLLVSGKFYMDKRKSFGVPEEFHEALGSFVYFELFYFYSPVYPAPSFPFQHFFSSCPLPPCPKP